LPGKKNLYVTDGVAVYKLDPTNGKVIWHYQAGADRNTYNITYTAIVLKDTVYFADQSSALYAVNAQNGTLRWKIKGTGDDWLEHPMTDGSVLYVHSQNRGLCRVDTQAGKLQKCYANLAPALFSQGLFYGFSPASADVHPTSIYAFDPAQGKKLWEKPIPIQGQGFQQMNLTNGTLYVTSETIYDKSNIPPLSSYIYAYNAQSGALIWKSVKVASDLLLNPPATVDGAVYFGAQDGRGGALSAQDGHVLWTFQTHAPTGGSIEAIYPTPAVANGVVYMGATTNGPDQHGNFLIALSASRGKVIWQKPLPAYMGNQLLLDNGIIYTGTVDSTLHAFKASDGSEIWHTTLGSPPSFSSGSDTLLLAA
jgi:outer membrane protein assembly factor BamB